MQRWLGPFCGRSQRQWQESHLLLLVPQASRFAAWGIVALLIAVFPANIHLYQNQDLMPASPFIHLLRLPLQGVFILWAFWHTRATKKDNDARTEFDSQ